MLTRNKDLDRSLVNGSRGVVTRITPSPTDSSSLVPTVKFDCGVTIPIAPVESVRNNPEGATGCLVRMQLPLKLAWAMTIHKSQGATLSRALLDVSNAFEFGQCYVALSRVKSLEGLWLVRPVRLSNIKVSPQVVDFFGELENTEQERRERDQGAEHWEDESGAKGGRGSGGEGDEEGKGAMGAGAGGSGDWNKGWAMEEEAVVVAKQKQKKYKLPPGFREDPNGNGILPF